MAKLFDKVGNVLNWLLLQIKLTSELGNDGKLVIEFVAHISVANDDGKLLIAVNKLVLQFKYPNVFGNVGKADNWLFWQSKKLTEAKAGRLVKEFVLQINILSEFGRFGKEVNELIEQSNSTNENGSDGKLCNKSFEQ